MKDPNPDLRRIEERMDPDLADRIYELDRCIECGCCVAACGTARMRKDFVGAVGMNRVARFRLDPRDARTDADYYDVIGDDDGVFGCMSLLACHDDCPKNLPLTTQIAFMRRKMAAPAGSRGAWPAGGPAGRRFPMVLISQSDPVDGGGPEVRQPCDWPNSSSSARRNSAACCSRPAPRKSSRSIPRPRPSCARSRPAATSDAIAARLTAHFADRDGAIEREVRAFIAELRERGLLEG